MDQEGLKIGHLGLKIMFWTQNTCFCQKKLFFLVKLAFEPARLSWACHIAWSLPDCLEPASDACVRPWNVQPGGGLVVKTNGEPNNIFGRLPRFFIDLSS